MIYSIGQFSKLSQVSIYTLRYYEKEGLLKPHRDEANRRCYTDEDYRWLLFLLRLKAVGMPIKEIKQYSDLRQQGDRTYPERMALLEQHLQILNANIHTLLDNREKLLEKIDFYKKELAKKCSN